jgi:hypothetical protein
MPFASAEIFDNQVEQWLMDIQFVRYSSSSFEIVCSDVVSLADNVNMDGIFEHGPIIPISAIWFLSGCRQNRSLVVSGDVKVNFVTDEDERLMPFDENVKHQVHLDVQAGRGH